MGGKGRGRKTVNSPLTALAIVPAAPAPRMQGGGNAGKKRGKGKRKGGRNPARGLTTAMMRPIVARVCAMTDAFCEEAYGARIPDGSKNTVTYQQRTLNGITTGASGSSVLVIYPNSAGSNFLFSTANPAVLQAAWQTLDGGALNTFIAGNVDRMRVVSAGVHWIPQVSLSNTRPVINVQFVAPGALLNGSFTPGNRYGMEYQVVDGNQEWFLPITPSDTAAARMFARTDAVATASAIDAWPALMITIQGPASQVVGSLDVCINYEGTIIEAGFGSGAYSRPIINPKVPAAIEAAENIAPMFQKARTSAYAAFSRAIEGAAASAVRGLMGAAMGSTGRAGMATMRLLGNAIPEVD